MGIINILATCQVMENGVRYLRTINESYRADATPLTVKLKMQEIAREWFLSVGRFDVVRTTLIIKYTHPHHGIIKMLWDYSSKGMV